MGNVSQRPLGSVLHARRVLHRVIERGVETEVLARNAASTIRPPKVED